MKRYKRLYIVSLILIAVVLTSVYFSYAFFANKSEQHGKLNVVVGDLKYKLESNDLVNGSITVPAGETKEITLTLTSLNSISSKYEIYYNLTNSNGVEVGYLNVPASGTIEANEVINIEVGIKNKGTSSTTVTFDLEKGLTNNQIAINNGTSLNQMEICRYNQGTTWNFDYTGSEQEFKVPCSGTYKLEVWGAQGGPSNTLSGGYGAYTSGNITFTRNIQLFFYVGAKGLVTSTGSISGIFNGGGQAGGQGGFETSRYWGTGGGATDVRLTSGVWNNSDSLKSRIMVAAAGGGSYNSLSGGAGGGLVGYDGAQDAGDDWGSKGSGGTQTEPGASYCAANSHCTNSWGYQAGYYAKGGFGYGGSSPIGCASGGGSGYYGGGASLHVQSAGGGSSFISGHSGCNAINSNGSHTGSSNHYSGYVFTNTVMIDGEGYNWTNVKGSYVGQPQPDGTTATGHSGNGYAKITLVSID